ncbi:N-acetylmuramoyl-L-alanine amidase [Cerasibacillus quisquiliarum]|uniref:Sporulation-specific N-acetylmuramoyl-L-alanine amidase n=1 Tax=Cerasibacillus quisquiliarum TaxID=227865 RepID=A0A511UWR9_9BACI|nr:N-acetylmuramoyl-L-alanine amidase [Cerasibacillus quisquiliarum]MBB5144907.1 N-acetylmuramoyl-L-alanine amidase [Cerasibacillus quisquiliarum]GEN30198.1 sporulation-specific N-acetylmuramoyl-L-alanine amidase [Cerasibacillus quisquiliarum]
MKLFIDPGHGGTDPGAQANGLQEKNLTLNIALKLRNILNQEYTGHSIMMSRTTDKTVSLRERTNMANNWGAHYLVSIHINAGGGTGFESFTYNGSYSGKSETNRLRSIIHDEIIRQTSFNNRGKKEANFHMLRESRMPSVLTENGFIDTVADANLLKQDAFLNKIARGHAVGIAKAFNLKKKSDSGTTTYYRVVAGSFVSRTYAEQRVNELKQKGYSSFIEVFQVSGTTYYRVICGSFTDRRNAEDRVTQLKKAGFEAFIVIVTI